MQVPVTVYTTGPSCQQCNMTKKVMQREGINFIEVDLRDHPDKAEEFKAQGYAQAPIVVTDTKIWSGFKLHKIESLSNYIRSAERKAS